MYKLQKQYRLKGYDYSGNGWYYVTICTAKRRLLFGDVINEIVDLSKIGKIVEKYWRGIPRHFKYTQLDEFVVMPNHLHGIVVINRSNRGDGCRNGVYTVPTDNVRDGIHPGRNGGIYTVPTNLLPNDPFDEDKTVRNNKEGLHPQPNSLSIIIREFKAAVTRWVRSNSNVKNVWQSRFYDRIIRDDEELENIREYIRDNPARWEDDRNFKKGQVSIRKSKSVKLKKLDKYMPKKNSQDTIGLFDESVEEGVEQQILTVTQFNSLIKDVLINLGVFKVKGEITEFNITKNKGVNITLSDGKANLRIGGYAPSINGIDFVEKDMDVVVTGVADLYINYGSFSLKAFSIEPVGEGSLARAYQKLKEKLEAEGLFAVEHKQELPQFITRVALLTGEDSAAYSDFVKILKENKCGVEILYYPVLVQGVKSVESIKAGLEDAREQDSDLIVLTRGGGSLEDLKSFNDENLARLIFSSSKPVIAGVGHEKDESISDFVADVRASTPSQAAYYIVERNKEFIDSVRMSGDNLSEILKGFLDQTERETENSIFAIENSILKLSREYNSTLEKFERILLSYDFGNTLKRGFAILKKGEERISSVKNLSVGDKIDALLADGCLNAKIDKIREFKYGEKIKAKDNRGKAK
jgi:exodeoxyribonuclease VII large subunit